MFEGPDGAKIFVDKKSLLYPERHRARLRHEPDQQGLRVQQPEREDDLRLRQLVWRVAQTSSAFLGLPRKLNVDMADLEQRYRALSRQFHPDYFYNAPPAERRASLERSSYLNDAYRALKQSRRRASSICCSSKGSRRRSRDRGRRSRCPPALLEEVFALNEELDEIRELRAGGAPAERTEGRGSRRARLPIEAKRTEHEAQLQELSARVGRGAGRRRLGRGASHGPRFAA